MLIYPRLVTRGVEQGLGFVQHLEHFTTMLIYPRLMTRGVEQGLGSI